MSKDHSMDNNWVKIKNDTGSTIWVNLNNVTRVYIMRSGNGNAKWYDIYTERAGDIRRIPLKFASEDAAHDALMELKPEIRQCFTTYEKLPRPI